MTTTTDPYELHIQKDAASLAKFNEVLRETLAEALDPDDVEPAIRAIVSDHGGLGRHRRLQLGRDMESETNATEGGWQRTRLARILSVEWIAALKRRSESGVLFGRDHRIEQALQAYVQR